MKTVQAYTFGTFQFVPARQMLRNQECAVRVGCRALDVLSVLVERPGEVISKAELIARAWPTTTVDESNLKVTMVALRKALDDDASSARFIATVNGRGYQFIAPVENFDVASERYKPLVDRRVHSAERAELSKLADMSDADRTPHFQGLTLRQPERSRGTCGPLHNVRFVDLPPFFTQEIDNGAPADINFEAVQYGVVVEGEVTLVFDETSILLTPGSLVIQPGRRHGWTNHSDRPCRLLCVMEKTHKPGVVPLFPGE